MVERRYWPQRALQSRRQLKEEALAVDTALREQTARQAATIEHLIKRDLIWQSCVASLLYARRPTLSTTLAAAAEERERLLVRAQLSGEGGE